MTEKAFSANFTMYSADGLRIQYTIREPMDDAQLAAHVATVLRLVQCAKAAGCSVTATGDQGDELPEHHWREEIAGYVVGQQGDKPRVWLYPVPMPLQKPCLTVYWEQQHLLPFQVTGYDTDADNAPDKDRARASGKFHEYPMTVVIRKEFKDGAPVMVKGTMHQKKTLVSVVGAPSVDPQEVTYPHLAPWEIQQQQLQQPGTGHSNGNMKQEPVAGYPKEWTGPVEAQIWAMKNGYFANERDARDAFKDMMASEFGGRLNLGNQAQVFLRFFEKLKLAGRVG